MHFPEQCIDSLGRFDHMPISFITCYSLMLNMHIQVFFLPLNRGCGNITHKIVTPLLGLVRKRMLLHN